MTHILSSGLKPLKAPYETRNFLLNFINISANIERNAFPIISRENDLSSKMQHNMHR